jgi:hypothetical protein
VTAGAAVALAAAALGRWAEPIAAALPGVSADEVGERLASGLTSWTSAIALLTVAGLARLVYSLRRHRVDDLAGRYRVWTWMIWGALALSANSVIGLHAPVARAATAMTGWSLTAGGAEWWLAPMALVGAWIGARVALEVAESRGALCMMVLSAACYAVAAAGSLGWSPAWLGGWSDAVVTAVPHVGHAILLGGVMLFARYVVLDVQGLIDHTPRRPAGRVEARPGAETEASPPTLKATAPALAAAPAAARKNEPTPPQRRPAVVVDEDEENDDPPAARYLSKAERKRLRKQQRRAA